MDQIRIDNLEVFAKHGVLPEETVLGQKFLVSAVMYLDVRKAGKNDDLTQSVSYADVCAFIYRYMQEHTFQLIEAVAEKLSTALLLEYGKIAELDLEIKKPWAPIGLSVDCVSVKIHRKWHRAVIALGSNMGDRLEYLTQGELALDARKDCRIIRSSSYMETKPYGVENQADFLNGAVIVDTLLGEEELLEVLHQIEAAANRVRTQHWGPRTLDMDIIFYDKEVYESDDLIIPHVDMQNRDFVLKPLAEICPNYRHPILGLTVTQMLANLDK